MNKVFICGNLTADPVLYDREYTNKETGEIIKSKVCNFTVAADEGYGERKQTQFFRVKVWRKLGEICQQYLKKGNKVMVEGPVSLNNYVDGNNNLRAVMEILAHDIQFMQNKPKEEEEPLY